MNKNTLIVKPHIFTFYHIFLKAFFLLIFPFLQQVFLYPESIWQKINYTIFNVLFIVIMFAIIYFEFKQISYFQTPHRITFKKGLFHGTEINLPANEITAVSVTRSIMLWLAKCCRVYISSSTCCKTRKVELFTSDNYAKQIVSFTTDKSARHTLYKSRVLYPTLMALTQSNTLTGAFAISVIIQRLSTLLGEKLANTVIEKLTIFPNIILKGIPPTLGYVAGFIFAGFLFGLISRIFINLNFTSFYNTRFLFVHKGFLKKSILCVKKSNLNGVLIKQTLLMSIVKIYTISLLYTGFKDDKNSGVYIPITLGNKLEAYISPVIPVESFYRKVQPPKTSIFSYIYPPLIYLGILVLFSALLYEHFEISFITRFISLALIPIGVLWLWFRLIAFEHCKVSYSENTIKINYYKKLNLMTALVKKNTVTKAVVSRNLIQRLFKKCHLTLYICDKKKVKIKIKHLNYNDVIKFITNSTLL